MPSWRTSCINDSQNAFNPDFEAQYAAASGNAFFPARLLMLMIQPLPPLSHVWQHRTAAVEDAREIGVDHVVPLLDGHGGNRGEHPHAGIVDQYVDPAEPCGGSVERTLDVRILANVGAFRDH
jgi:hypothetical protein